MKKPLKNICTAFVVLVIGFTSVSCGTASKSSSSKKTSSAVASVVSESANRYENWEELIEETMQNRFSVQKCEFVTTDKGNTHLSLEVVDINEWKEFFAWTGILCLSMPLQSTMITNDVEIDGVIININNEEATLFGFNTGYSSAFSSGFYTTLSNASENAEIENAYNETVGMFDFAKTLK